MAVISFQYFTHIVYEENMKNSRSVLRKDYEFMTSAMFSISSVDSGATFGGEI